MTVLAVVSNEHDVEQLVKWSALFAKARKTDLTIFCWALSPIESHPLLADSKDLEELAPLGKRVRSALDDLADDPTLSGSDVVKKAKTQFSLHPSGVTAALEYIRDHDITMVVSQEVADDEINPALRLDARQLGRQSPADSITFQRFGKSTRRRRILAGLLDSPHDSLIARLAYRFAQTGCGQVTLGYVEETADQQGKEVGARALRQLLREAGIKKHSGMRRKVYIREELDELHGAAEKHDLILIGLNERRVAGRIINLTEQASLALVKRGPPLKFGAQKTEQTNWNARINPGDYADLVQSLRRGSKLNADFLVMLGLASAIASLGLLQNSPAVVIGSMLLAPLMTPMIGNGLSLAQANPKLGRACLKSILVGFLMTLIISSVVAWVTPGRDMTPEVTARGDPNLLDLMIALFSAMAAAYAMGRPNILGAAAGVAIATALVPPLCSVGISLVYREYLNALGATALFATNLVAIILGAACAFRLMGVTFGRAGDFQRRWVGRMLIILSIAVLGLAVPLHQALSRSIDQGKPRPNTFPLPSSVTNRVAEYVEELDDIYLVASGRPAVADDADVILVLASKDPLPQRHFDKLERMIREEMHNTELVIEIHCLQTAGVDTDIDKKKDEAQAENDQQEAEAKAKAEEEADKND